MSGDKGINLMPEDLRSKEQEALAKGRDTFQPDLVVPGKGLSLDLGKPTGSQESFWSKLGKMFQSKPKTPKPKKDHKSKGSILAREMKRNGKNKKMDSIKAPVEHIHQPVNGNGSILAREMKRNGDHKPELPKTVDPGPKPPQSTPEAPKNDFVIPQESIITAMRPVGPIPEEPQPEKKKGKKKKEKKVKPPKEKKKKKDKSLGFHQPELRIKPRVISEGGGVDLIPTSVKVRSWRQVSNLILLSFIGSLVIMGIFYLSLFIQERNIKVGQANRDRQISDLEVQILKFESFNRTIDVLGQDIKMTHKAINEHIYWTNFFRLLEKYTVSDVYYAGFAAGNDGALTLSATGGSYDSVAKQLKLLQQPEASEFIQEVNISGAQLANGGVQFSMVLVLNQDLFYYKEDVAIENIEGNEGDDQGSRD